MHVMEVHWICVMNNWEPHTSNVPFVGLGFRVAQKPSRIPNLGPIYTMVEKSTGHEF